MRSKEDFIKSLSREELAIYNTYNFMYKSVDYYNKAKTRSIYIDIESNIDTVINRLIEFRDLYVREDIKSEDIHLELSTDEDEAQCNISIRTVETEEEFSARVDLEEKRIRDQIKSIDAKYEIALEDLKSLKKENEELKNVINTLKKFNI
jgi:hypothetical protein